MPKLLFIARRLVKRPFRSRGSILIMVVAVLVLLALMGTAYISVARLDRAASVPLNDASVNDILDQLLPGLQATAQNVIKSAVQGQVAGVTSYRPAVPPGVLNNDALASFHNWDGTSANWMLPSNLATPPGSLQFYPANDGWLASRVPTLGVPTNVATVAYLEIWNSLSRPLTQPANTTANPTPVYFESPFDVGLTKMPPGKRVGVLANYPRYLQDVDTNAFPTSAPLYFVPTSMTVTYSATYPDSSLAGRTRVFPALELIHPKSMAAGVLQGIVVPDGSGKPLKFLAADADGDGVADSGLWKLTTVGDVTYYAACRIIDNNSAINVNTAWSRNTDFDFSNATRLPNWIFPASVGLLELFPSYVPAGVGGTSVEMDAVNQWRSNNTANASPWAPNTPMDDPTTAPPPIATATSRGDFLFQSQAEALYNVLGCRIDNPGYRQGPTLYQPFTPDTNLDLYYRGGMANLNDNYPATGTLDEQLFQKTGGSTSANGTDSVYSSAPNETSPASNPSLTSRFRFLPPSENDYWWQYSFNYDATRATYFSGLLPAAASSTLSIRPLLTTYNPVSILTSGHTTLSSNIPDDAMLPYGCRGRYSPLLAYSAGDFVYFYDSARTPNENRIYYATGPAALGATPPASPWVECVPRGAWLTAGSYDIGHMVRADLSAGAAIPNWKVFISTAAANKTNPALGGTGWAQLPTYAAAPKVSLNTAPFGELYRGFWNVMAEASGAAGAVTFSTPVDLAVAQQTAKPVYTAAGFDNSTLPATFNNPYIGMQFFDVTGNPNTTPAPIPFEAKKADTDTTPNPAINSAAMFRSVIRALPDVTNPAQPYTQATRRMTPAAVMQIRAALAAVNAEDARDADNDVTSRKISVPMQESGKTIMCDVVVYGTEAQPYITEIYANSDVTPSGPGNLSNEAGYLAIELYNPYPFDIPLTNWRLVALNRVPIGTLASNGENMPLTDTVAPGNSQVLANFSDPSGGSYPTPIVPAHGYLLLENYGDSTTPGDPYYLYATSATPHQTPALYRPASSGLPLTGPIQDANLGNDPSTVPSKRLAPLPRLNVAYLPLPEPNTLGPNALAGVYPNTPFNQEIVFMKPRRFDGTYSSTVTVPSAADRSRMGLISEDPNDPNTGLPGGNLARYIQDFVPVDSFDLTGLVLSNPNYNLPDAIGTAASLAGAYHYVRASNNDSAQPGGLKNWHFVYPGRYDATNTIANPTGVPPTVMRARQQGTWESSWDPTGTPSIPPQRDAWDSDDIYGSSRTAGTGTLPVPPVSLGQTYNAPGTSTNAADRASYPVTFPIQLANNNFVINSDLTAATPQPGSQIGWNGVPRGAANAAFPFGGFTRTADVLYVPYIGAYRITVNPADPSYVPGTMDNTIVELNSVTMDAALAEDTDPGNDPSYDPTTGAPLNTGAVTEIIEQVGRFCPPAKPSTVTPAYISPLANYEWAYDVLDYFTAVQNSNDDFLPNTDPARYHLASATVIPRPVANSMMNSTTAVPANTDQDYGSGTQGQININTADWKTLSMLPLVVNNAGVVDLTPVSGIPKNELLAKAIVYYRDVDDSNAAATPTPPHPHGPFKSLFELNNVLNPGSTNGFQNMMGDLDFTQDTDDTQGDFTPYNSSPVVQNAASSTYPYATPGDGVRLDFEKRNLTLIRLSNLLTTRSDTFTCYMLLQGWKNAGTDHPQLVGERRSAFVVDRSQLSTTNTTLKTLTVPTR